MPSPGRTTDRVLPGLAVIWAASACTEQRLNSCLQPARCCRCTVHDVAPYAHTGLDKKAAIDYNAIVIDCSRRWGSLVSEGRDQGTVVFPQADVKIYLDADPHVRADRRRKELAGRGSEVPLEELAADIRRRDESDRSRAVGPLRAAADAVVVDTTGMGIEEMVDRLEELVRRRSGER